MPGFRSEERPFVRLLTLSVDRVRNSGSISCQSKCQKFETFQEDALTETAALS